MAFNEEGSNGMIMPVAPAYGGYNGMGGFGGDSWWGILLLIAILNGGFGFGGMGGWGGMMGTGMMDGFGLYPWLNNSQNINGGFRDQMLGTQVASIGDKITSGFGDMATQLCGGFAGVNANISNGFAQAEIGENARQMANMQQMFSLQSALQQCCCDNRAATADLKYTVATEACADRAAISEGIRDVMTANTANTQAILDKLCALELDGYKREADNLRTQLNMATLRESQTAQTAQILAGQAAEIDGVYNRLKNCPVGTVPVFGNQPIFTCPTNLNPGCGCGCAG